MATEKAVGGILTARTGPPTGPASPRCLVCAPGDDRPAHRRPNASGSGNMVVREPSHPMRVKGFDRLKGSLALCCAVVAVLLLAAQFVRPRAEKGLDTRGWKLADFLEHLERRGLKLHAVPTAHTGWPSESAYLTEN